MTGRGRELADTIHRKKSKGFVCARDEKPDARAARLEALEQGSKFSIKARIRRAIE